MEKLLGSTGKRKSSEPMNSFGLEACSLVFYSQKAWFQLLTSIANYDPAFLLRGFRKFVPKIKKTTCKFRISRLTVAQPEARKYLAIFDFSA